MNTTSNINNPQFVMDMEDPMAEYDDENSRLFDDDGNVIIDYAALARPKPVTLHDVRFQFDLCNILYFNGRLPRISLRLMKSTKLAGRFEYKLGFTKPFFKAEIAISTSYYMSYNELRNLMVHEMIHYYLAYFGKDTKCRHGRQFKKMMRELNKEYGLHVATHSELSDEMIKAPTPHKKSLWQIINDFISLD